MENSISMNARNMKLNIDQLLSCSIYTEKVDNVTYHYISIDNGENTKYNNLKDFFNDFLFCRDSIISLFELLKDNAFELLASFIGRYPTSGKYKKYTVKRIDNDDILDDNVSIDFNWKGPNNCIVVNYTSGYKTFYNPTIEDFSELFDIKSSLEFENALFDLINLFEKMKEIDTRYYFRGLVKDTYHRFKYPTIAIIGSTKFEKQFKTSAQYFQLLGYVVLTTFVYDGIKGIPVPKGVEDMFVELGCQRIDMADEVFVINVGGYIGESTSKEIEYAKSINKRVSYYTEQF